MSVNPRERGSIVPNRPVSISSPDLGKASASGLILAQFRVSLISARFRALWLSSYEDDCPRRTSCLLRSGQSLVREASHGAQNTACTGRPLQHLRLTDEQRKSSRACCLDLGTYVLPDIWQRFFKVARFAVELGNLAAQQARLRDASMFANAALHRRTSRASPKRPASPRGADGRAISPRSALAFGRPLDDQVSEHLVLWHAFRLLGLVGRSVHDPCASSTVFSKRPGGGSA